LFMSAIDQIGSHNPINKVQKQNGLDYLIEEIEGAL
jgi:hypothetical protein